MTTTSVRTADPAALMAVPMAVSALAVAAGTASAQTLTVMHQGDPNRVATYESVVERFEAANPGVDVRLIHAPHDAYNETLGAAIMSGDLADIIELDAPFLASYVWSGHLRPLEGWSTRR